MLVLEITKREKLVGVGSVGSTPRIDNVSLVEGLKFNLLSISQICDNLNWVIFKVYHCRVKDVRTDATVLKGHRSENVYLVSLDELKESKVTCLISQEDLSRLWHRKLGHTSIYAIEKLSRKDLVKGLPKMRFEKGVCIQSLSTRKTNQNIIQIQERSIYY